MVTFGGPRFLALQITCTRKRKSAVRFVCGQSGSGRFLARARAREPLDADEARSKDSSNPFSSPLDFTAAVIISAHAETASPGAHLSDTREIKIASCRLFHQRASRFMAVPLKCPIN